VAADLGNSLIWLFATPTRTWVNLESLPQNATILNIQVYTPGKRRQKRFPGKPKCRANAQNVAQSAQDPLQIDSEGRELASAYDRMLKVACTITDLAGSKGIWPPHVQQSNTGPSRELIKKVWEADPLRCPKCSR
jgi:hypothetical protein